MPERLFQAESWGGIANAFIASNSNEWNVHTDMRTLLRNTVTGLYFQGPDLWTSDPAVARDFKLIDRALKFVETWRLQDMELAFAFRNVGRVTRVPIEKTAIKYSES